MHHPCGVQRCRHRGRTGNGKAIAETLLAEGARVALLDIDPESLSPLDGTKPYRITLPERHPPPNGSGRSPSTTTRRARCCRPPQRFPRAGSQSYPSPAAGRRPRRLDRGPHRTGHNPTASNAATGSRPCPPRLVRGAYASTAHWTGSSTRPGDHPEVEAV